MLSNRHKHKRRQTAASRSESVFPLHQATRQGGVVSPGGRTRANKRKTSRLCLASLSAFLPPRHFRKKECNFSSPARFLLIYYFCYWIKLIYVTTARAAVNHLTPKLLLATLSVCISDDFPLNTITEERKKKKNGFQLFKDRRKIEAVSKL